VKHADAWQRLPDLLEDRDHPDLLAHVRGCAECQRQLFLLGRVDRMLSDNAPARQSRLHIRRGGSTILAIGAAAAVLLVLLIPRGSGAHAFAFRTASGRLVGRVSMTQADSRNDSVALVARRLPVNHRHVFVLWAADARSSMPVGRFMVDRSGGCRVHFNLPANHHWNRFWISPPGNATTIVAST
jgi:hypothetical protein